MSEQSPISYINQMAGNDDIAQQATDAHQQVVNNSASTDEAQQVRGEVCADIEMANRENVAMLPAYSQKEEMFWYDTVDIELFGGVGPSRQRPNIVTLNR